MTFRSPPVFRRETAHFAYFFTSAVIPRHHRSPCKTRQLIRLGQPRAGWGEKPETPIMPQSCGQEAEPGLAVGPSVARLHFVTGSVHETDRQPVLWVEVLKMTYPNSQPLPVGAPLSVGHEARVFGLRSDVVALSCGRIRYIDEGAGPVMVLLHGAPFTSLGFTSLIRYLRRKHRVIAPDFPGFGGSTASPTFAGRLNDYSDFVEEFCAALRLDDVHLYLNDSSGCIGLYASQALRSRLAGVVIASTVALPLEGARQLVRFMLRYVVGSRFSGWLNRRYNWLARLVARQATGLSKRERRVLVEQFPTARSRDAILDLFRHMANDDPFMQEAARRCHQCLSSLPVLILYGDEDPMYRLGAAAHYQRELPHAEVRVLPGHHHFPMLSGPTDVGGAIEEWMDDSRAVCPFRGSKPLEVAS